MGYIKHEMVVAEVFEAEKLNPLFEDLRDQIKETTVSPSILVGPIEVCNGYTFWALFPDGSKEGWTTSDEGDWIRSEFLRIVKKDKWPGYVHFRFLGDDGGFQVYDSSAKGD